jgi:hypothetical protein
MPVMDKNSTEGFKVEVVDDVIAVTFIGTNFKVAYRKPPTRSGLAPTGFSKEADSTLAQIAAFLSVALRLANDKARLLGWIA